jgi:hypothetical protein
MPGPGFIFGSALRAKPLTCEHLERFGCVSRPEQPTRIIHARPIRR